uniref:NAD(+) kinase n=1 Tax=Glossina austeni TaxID=7395 RepID=A0A1A9VJS9_GLOAU
MTEINYHKVTIVMTDGQEFETRSAYGKEGDRIKLDRDPLTHPAWTGSLTSGSAKENKSEIDLLIVVGGDGFMLRTLHNYVIENKNTHVYGVNTGNVGFLMNKCFKDLIDHIEHATSTQLTLLKMEATDTSGKKYHYIALISEGNMPGTQDTVKPLSYTPIDKDGKTSPGTSPIPALRTSIPKQASPEEAEKFTSDTLSPTASLGLGGSSGNEPEEPIYAIINPDTKSSKKSLDSGIDNQSSGMKKSVSQETEFSDPWDREKSEKDMLEKFNNSLTPSLLESDDTNSEMDSEIPLISPSKKTNRIWPRAKYAMQQKGFIIFTATAIILSTSAALVYLQDKAKFIAFFTNSPKCITIPVIALAALLAISPIFFAIKQFRNTEEHHIQKEDANEILAEVLEHQPKDKAIKSVRLEYSNGTHSNFVLNAWESKNDFINIGEKVVSRTNKIESVINDRPLFTALLASVIAANVALPLWLLATNGVNGVQKFYQNPLTNDIGLSLLIGSGILTLSIICLSVHYYRKTNCTNLIYSQEEVDTKSVNEKFIEKIKRERTNVLGENHKSSTVQSAAESPPPAMTIVLS